MCPRGLHLCKLWSANFPLFLSARVFKILHFVESLMIILKPASWSSGNAFVSGAGGQRFESRAGQIRHSVANGSPPLQHFFERSCVAWAQ